MSMPIPDNIKSLTDEELVYALWEMRKRGWAVAAYNPDEMREIFSIDPESQQKAETDAWFADNRQNMEEAMCEAARELMAEFVHQAYL